jgi:hypothetical protein
MLIFFEEVVTVLVFLVPGGLVQEKSQSHHTYLSNQRAVQCGTAGVTIGVNSLLQMTRASEERLAGIGECTKYLAVKPGQRGGEREQHESSTRTASAAHSWRPTVMKGVVGGRNGQLAVASDPSLSRWSAG